MRHVRPEAMFLPVAALALWTFAIAITVGVRRVRAARAGRVSPEAFRLGEGPGVPPDVVVANRNFMNLLELPVLFYVVAIGLYVTRHVGRAPVTLGWLYVGLRVVHSAIHLTTNRVMHRLATFVASNVVLVAIWVRFISALWL
jgi:hypothetical protein